MSRDRTDVERAFFDDAYSRPDRPLNGFYEVSAGVRAFENAIFRECDGLSFLEYGCGMGGHAFELANRGAVVTGIDISEVAVEKARERAGSSRRLTFQVANAEHLPYPPESFDVVCGTSILHHLDTERAIREIRRVLKPDGRAVFYEPIGYNPAANLYRRLTPKLHTPDEHPLVRRDFQAILRLFPGTKFRFYDFLSVAAIPVLRVPGGVKLLHALDAIDRVLLASPLRLLGNVVVIEMRA